jgi:hypothetical protein
MNGDGEEKDFMKMNVTEIKKFLIDRGVSVNGYLKPALAEIASCVLKMGLPTIQSMIGKSCDDTIEGKLIIHEMEIENPFKMKAVNNFVDSPPFGLYDIFNYLIYHSTEYDKQGLAAYKSFDDYRLFEEGYVKSLLTKTMLNEGIHVYVGKVQPAMKKKPMKGNTSMICILFWKGEALTEGVF